MTLIRSPAWAAASDKERKSQESINRSEEYGRARHTFVSQPALQCLSIIPLPSCSIGDISESLSALPAYCRGFDVGVIPFKTNELTTRANPLKLREYLAAGLPVVSTPLPEVARYADLVYLKNGADAFLTGIDAALGERSEEMVRRRVEAMRSEMWEARVADMSGLIGARLGVRV